MQRYKEAILYSIFIILMFVYSIVRIRPEITNIINIEKEIGTKTTEFTDLDRRLETLKASEMEKLSSSKKLKNIYKPAEAGLDAESSFAVLFDDLVEMAKYNSIKIYSIEYIYNPQDDEFVKGAADKYNVCRVKMQVVGDYNDLQSFLRDIYKYPYLINLSKIELTPYEKNKKILLANVQLKLYSQKG